MKYKFCSIHINVTKYDVTFATKGVYPPAPVATALSGRNNAEVWGRSPQA